MVHNLWTFEAKKFWVRYSGIFKKIFLTQLELYNSGTQFLSKMRSIIQPVLKKEQNWVELEDRGNDRIERPKFTFSPDFDSNQNVQCDNHFVIYKNDVLQIWAWKNFLSRDLSHSQPFAGSKGKFPWIVRLG